MALFDHDVLLASIDQALASLRAVLVVRADPEQTDEVRVELARRAATELANLPEEPSARDWPGVPDAAFHALAQAKQSAREGEIEDAHRHLTGAREILGGRSA